jgi:coproporphyrinogen III oxidase-like Fe-S oxidoreductase
MLTGLRLIEEGVSAADFQRRFGVPIRDVYGSALDWLTCNGLLRTDGDSIRLTPRARLLSNRVFVQFMPG